MLQLAAALLLAQVLPAVPLETPAPFPSPSPGATAPPNRAPHGDYVDIEAGGSNSYLNNGRGRWESSYESATFAQPSGFKVHVDALNDVHFGTSVDTYAVRTDIPTGHPNGILDLGYAYSAHNAVIPTNAFIAGYDLHEGGGWQYRFGYVGTSYASASAANYGFGVDKHWKHQSLGAFINLATVSKHSGTGVSEGLRWSEDLPQDTVSLTSGIGRSVQSTGRNRVAIHDTFGIDAGELHWLDPHTALRADLGYFSVSKAYQRFFVLLGIRVRIGRI